MRTREEGQALVRQYNQSQLTKSEFSRREGVSIHVLRYWQARVDNNKPKKKVRFIELQTGSITKASTGRLRVELPTGATLHFEDTPDLDLLLRLVFNNQAV